MKKMKKYLSMSLAVMMALAMAAPSFAEPTSGATTSTESIWNAPMTSIKIEGEDNSHKYNAYKLLDSSDGSNGNDELYAYTVNNKYAVILGEVLSEVQKDVKEEDKKTDVIEYLKSFKIETTDSSEVKDAKNNKIREYADAVYRKIANANPKIDPEVKEFANATSINVSQGYYLIADVTSLTGTDASGNPTLSNDTNSLVMLNTAGKTELTVKVKKDKPQVDKKIVENDGTEVDTADATVGEEVLYRLKGALPTDYATYKNYYYEFIDTLSPGLDFVSSKDKVVIKIGTKTDKTIESAEVDKAEVLSERDGVTITVDNNKKELRVAFADLKTLEQKGINITKDSVIFVEYKAKLNSDAVIGAPGNDNHVKLEYTNNPYDDGKGEKGTTPDEYVELLTFKLAINKTTEDGTPLKGANFTLYKEIATENTDSDGNPIMDWAELDVLNANDKAGVATKDTTTFNFERLGEGNYKIVETTVPDGYNKADDITFTIKAKTEQILGANGPEGKITSLSLTNVLVGGKKPVNGEGKEIDIFTYGKTSEGEEGEFTGIVTTGIVNVAGALLPSTGGIGTTIFYAAGIILMAGAVFFVVRRKKA